MISSTIVETLINYREYNFFKRTNKKKKRSGIILKFVISSKTRINCRIVNTNFSNK